MKQFVWISVAGYLAAAAALVLLDPTSLPSFYDPVLMSSLAVVSAALILLPRLFLRPKSETQRVALLHMQTLIAFGLIINGAGGLGLYKIDIAGLGYDKATHFATSLIFAAGIAAFIRGWFSKDLKKALAISAVLVFAGGVIWEFLEAFSDRVLGTTFLGGGTGGIFEDTLLDMIANILGIAAGIWFAARRGRIAKGR